MNKRVRRDWLSTRMKGKYTKVTIIDVKLLVFLVFNRT